MDVDVDQAPRDVIGLIEERPDRHDSRIIDQDVDWALRRLGGIDEGRERLAIGDVEAQPDRPQPRRRRLNRRDVDVAQRQPGAVPAQALGGRGADPARSTGDRNVQPQHPDRIGHETTLPCAPPHASREPARRSSGAAPTSQ